MLTYDTITLPNALREIRESAFEETEAEAIILPEALEAIDESAFAGGKVHVVVFLNGEAEIAETAFDDCLQFRFACDPASSVGEWAVSHGIPVTTCLYDGVE